MALLPQLPRPHSSLNPRKASFSGSRCETYRSHGSWTITVLHSLLSCNQRCRGWRPSADMGTRESRGGCSGRVQLSCYVVKRKYEVFNNASERDFGEVSVPQSSEVEPSGVTPV